MDQVFEGTPKAELRVEGRKIVRTDVTNDWGSRLQWKVSRDGQVIATLSARASLEYEPAEPAPGAYEVVLEMWKYEGYKKGGQGRYVEISNKAAFQI